MFLATKSYSKSQITETENKPKTDQQKTNNYCNHKVKKLQE